jgi:ATP-dependent DNA ligase
VFAHACKMGLEGIVSKRKDSTYRSGRSADWLKSKPDMRGGEAGGGGRLEAMTKGGQEPHPEGQNINDRPSEKVAIA